MLTVDCPDCAAPLRLRLSAETWSPARCGVCVRSLDLKFLAQSGMAEDLIERTRIWGKSIARVTGIGRDGRIGSELDDAGFIAAWRSAREQARTLLSDLRRYCPAELDVLGEGFETPPPEEWTDAEILSWRLLKDRLRWIEKYAETLAEQYVDQGGAPPSGFEPFRFPYPTGLRSEEERRCFRSGFTQGAHFGTRAWSHLGTRADRLAELERRLGIRP